MRSISLILITALLTTSLAGCGRPPVPMASAVVADRAEAEGERSAKLARDFSVKIRQRFEGNVGIKGSVVTLHYHLMAPTHYDFSKTPRTGMVHVSSKDFELELELEKVMQSAEIDALPALVIPIAIEMAIGAAKGLSIYWLTHRGEKFNKQEAIKATAVGMLSALIPFVGQVAILNQLFPLAVGILAASKSLHYKDIAQAALNMVDEIVMVLTNIRWHREK